MRKQLLILLSLSLAACGGAETKTDTAASPCVDFTEEARTMAGKQLRVYYLAPGFNPKSKECWQALKDAADNTDGTSETATVISFLDTTTFKPGSDGLYGSEAARRRVIAQVLINKAADLKMVTADPFGYGKYTETK